MIIDWGPLGDIKSEITNKRLAVFLNRLKNEAHIDLILWFFENVYDEKKHVIGIQKNVHIYQRNRTEGLTDLSNQFLLRFENDEKDNSLYIRFERGNNLSSPLIEMVETVKGSDSSLYDKVKKQIVIKGDIDDYEIAHAKRLLKDLLDRYFDN